jgi:hypothetical protein
MNTQAHGCFREIDLLRRIKLLNCSLKLRTTVIEVRTTPYLEHRRERHTQTGDSSNAAALNLIRPIEICGMTERHSCCGDNSGAKFSEVFDLHLNSGFGLNVGENYFIVGPPNPGNP